MSESTGAWRTAVASLIAAAESKLRRHISDTPVYAITPKDPSVGLVPAPPTNGHRPKDSPVNEHVKELDDELHRLHLDLARSARQHVQAESAEHRTASRVRRIVLWTRLFIGAVVQVGLLTWLGWEIVHSVSYSHLILPVLTNVLNGSTSAYTARRFLGAGQAWSHRGDPTARTADRPAGGERKRRSGPRP